jgi:hypothetical protein
MVQTIATCEDLVAQIDAQGIAATVKAHRKPPLLSRILRELYELYHDQDRYVCFLAHYPLIPSDLADQIASTLDPAKVDIAIGLAGNPRCPQLSLNRLVEHPDISVRHALASNPNLTPKEFQALAVDENSFVRAALATNPALPTPLQFVLSDDASATVRIALAERKNLDTDVAVHLANSKDLLTSAATILNYSLDDELLQLWAEQDQPSQQRLLLKRKQPLPDSVRTALRLSPGGDVLRSTLKNTTISGPEMLYLAESEDSRDRIFLADQADLPTSIQRLLAQDTAPRVRRRLAANPCIHESIALHIVASNDMDACRALTQNPATSDTTLCELCLYPDDAIALLVAYREDLQAHHYDLLLNHRETFAVAEHIAYQDIGHCTLSEPVSQHLAEHPTPGIRLFAARSLLLDAATRDALTQDPCPAVRKQLAQNPTLSERQLRTLIDDSNREVLFAAEENSARRIREQTASTPANAAQRATQPQAAPSAPTQKGALFNKITDFFTD